VETRPALLGQFCLVQFKRYACAIYRRIMCQGRLSSSPNPRSLIYSASSAARPTGFSYNSQSSRLISNGTCTEDINYCCYCNVQYLYRVLLQYLRDIKFVLQLPGDSLREALTMCKEVPLHYFIATGARGSA
jgi:hypothetical protein